MYLLNIVNARRKINDYRKEMHELAMVKGLNDPEVLKVSVKLDEVINMYYHFLQNVNGQIVRKKDPII